MFPAVADAIACLGAIAHELNSRMRSEARSCLLVPDHLQFAAYPPSRIKGKYKPHRDNYWDSSQRMRANDRDVTCIFYLNDGWAECDGGQLRLHPEARLADDETLLRSWSGGHRGSGGAGPYVDVTPSAGRVAIFRSELLHEVLPNLSQRWRYALTMWVVTVV